MILPENSAVAVLSATTTNVIYGHPPELKKTIDKEAFKLNLYLDEKHSIEFTPHTDKKYYIGANIKFSWYWTSDYRDDGLNTEQIRFAYGMVQGNINYGNRASNKIFYNVCVEDI